MQSLSDGGFCETSSRNRPLSIYSLSSDRDFDIRAIIEGDLDHLPPLPSRTIRVFLSSTFSDMIPERNALMEHVYPQLKNFCRQQYRLEFQVIDLRWGIREQSHDDHTIIDFCLKEIDNCKSVSLGPSFVVLIGQKYGYRPFPPTINAREFETIRDELIARGQDVILLDTWFKRNTNVTTAVYNLQPISSILPNYANKSDENLQQSAIEEWSQVYKSLQQLLRAGVQSCVENGRLPEVSKDKYFISVTEYEIEKGMLAADDACYSCLCFVRHIKNLEMNHNHPEAQKYLDIVDGSDVIDVDAQRLLSVLQNEKISQVLTDERNLEYFQTTWSTHDKHAPSADPVYLNEFCNTFRDKMQWMINRAAQRLRSISCHQRLVEILQHLTMCKSRSEAFKGREDALKRIRLYTGSSTRRPIVLYGESGSGKTSVVAKVASLVYLWFEGKAAKPVVIVRFLGTTSYSCSIRLVLGGICWQIASAYGRDMDTIPSDYPGLVVYFKEILNVAKPDRPLVILLDGLDQLCPDHRAYGLAWLPSYLPPDVYVVLSTLPDKHELLDTLTALIPDKNSFIHILSLGPQLSINLVKEWLHRAGRDLTAAQYDIVENALSACNLPLYTTLVFQEVCRWFSYSTPDQTVLEPTVTRIINMLFDRIEKYHGHVFVSHALSYLTASKNGLSDRELDDLLSLDDVVLNDVFQHWLPPLRRIPPLLLPRLQDELSSYIMQREANETVVFYWYHGQFISAARERYLSDPSHRVSTHSTLAQYFLGTWGGGKKKPFRYSVKQLRWLNLKTKESKADRKVSAQPLHYGHDSQNTSTLNYNLRKLSELPYHLLESNMVAELMGQVLFDYDWLHAKLTAMSLHDVLSDFNLAISRGLRNSDIWLLAGALRVGGNHVNQNPDTLAFDLIGRLLQYYDKDKGSEFGHLRQLLRQCDTQSPKHSALIPILQCFDPPTAELLYVLEGHSQVASDIVFSATTNELISVSKDGTIAFWDLSTGERSRTIDVSRLQPGRKTRLFQSSDGKYLIVDYDTVDSPIEIYETKTGQLLYSCGARLSTQSRGFLAGNLYCRQKTIMDIRTGQEVQTIDHFVKTKAYVTCAISPNAKLLIIGDATDMKLFDISTGNLVASNTEGKLLSVLAVTADSRRCYAGYAIDCMFRVFELDSGFETLAKYNCNQALVHLSQVAVGNEQRFPRELSELSISPTCQDLVLINFRRFRLILLNVADSTVKVMDAHCSDCSAPQAIMSSTFNFDGKLALASDENFLHVWSTETATLLKSINIHSTPNFPLAVSPNRNLVATGSTIHTAIKVWNLDRAQKHEIQMAKVYESPVDCVACAPRNGLIFVKNYYGLASSNKGYKFIDSFGIDIWNLATGQCHTFLHFRKYGKLLKMTVCSEGDQMALLLNAINIWYVVILCNGGKKIRCVATHRPGYSCHSFIVSSDWDHMTTCVSCEVGSHLVVLWDLSKGEEVIRFEDARSPVFSLDSQYLVYVYRRQMVICYCLKTMAPAFKISEEVDRLQVIPARHGLILMTRFEDRYSSTISVWHFQEDKRNPRIILRSASPTGIQDISKDGRLAVDGFLQVFDLETGSLVVRLGSISMMEELSTVRMTYDGKYVVWVEHVSVRVGRVHDGAIIANTSTHERTTCLHTMSFGYVLVLGREDGHLLTMRLIDQMNEKTIYTPEDANDRRKLILSYDVCPQKVRRQFDQNYQEEQMQMVSDADIPQVDDDISNCLMEYADVPHAVISTAVPSTDSDVDDNCDMPRLFPDNSRKRMSLTSGGSPLGDRATRSNSRDIENRSNTPSPDRHIKGHCTSTSSLASSNGAGGARGSTLPRFGQNAKRSSSAQDLHRLHIKSSAVEGASSSKSGRLHLGQELSRLVRGSRNKEKIQHRGSQFLRSLFRSKPD